MRMKRKDSDMRNGVSGKSSKPKGDHFHTKNSLNSKPTKTGKQPIGTSLIFEPRPDWHAIELPSVPVSASLHPLPDQTLKSLQEYALSLLEADNATYSSTQNSSSSSHKFLGTIMASGTWEDKVSALTLLVQESPLHNTKALENLLGLAKKRSRNQALLAIQAIKDLFAQGVVLPPDRKLRPFGRQPGLLAAFQGKVANWRAGDPLPNGLEKVHLIYWAYEDWLKKTYFMLLTIVESWGNDEVEFSRKRAITIVFELLKEKPEQEENLLRLLVNKLGDKEKRVASRASYLLLQLQSAHPAMKPIIVNAIESELLWKPGQTLHAKYYAIITLNQTVLTMREQEVANRLLAIYFNLFFVLLKEPENGRKSLTHPDLNGVQGGGGKPGRKARQKAKSQEAANASEREMNDKLIAQVLTGVNRAYPFANTDDSDFEQHLNTMFRITHSANFNTSIQALMLIQQISSSKHYSADRFYRTLYESLLDPRVLNSSKQVMYLNLLYKSLKADVSVRRVQAFVKRLLQVITMHEPPFISGVLFLISSLESTFPSIRAMFTQPEELDSTGIPPSQPPNNNSTNDTNGDNNDNDPTPHADPTSTPSPPRYDPRKRDPSHAHAQHTCLWELLPFLTHHHPSISLAASHLLSGKAAPSQPEPAHYTLMHFLDRFAYRSARTKAAAPRGASIMQPLGGAETADRLVGARGERERERVRGGRGGDVNSEAFWMRRVEDVAADEVFFHRYFAEKGKRMEGARRRKERRGRKRGEGGASDESGDEEDEIWKALVKSRPEVEGGDEGDEFEEDGDGLDMDDMESSDGGVDVEGGLGEEDEDVEMNLLDEDEGGVFDGADVPDLEDDDQEAFVGSDQELPSDFEQLESSDEKEEAKNEAQEKSTRSKKRRKLKSLPTFASVDDYAKYLGSEDEGV
ncbi:MAG: hypothetical protein Q9165_005185 [Trypethelium subeluteriae]